MARKDFNEAAKRATEGFFGNERGPADRAAAETNEKIANPDAAEHEVKLAGPAIAGSGDQPDKKRDEKKRKTSFSFRGTPEDVRKWQAYGIAVKTVHSSMEKFCTDDLWREAIEEYIERHPLKGLAREIYEKKSKL